MSESILGKPEFSKPSCATFWYVNLDGPTEAKNDEGVRFSEFGYIKMTVKEDD